MISKKQKTNEIMGIQNFIDYKKKLETEDETFKKLMFIYSVAIKQLETQIDILKDELKIFYKYDLINHVNTRIKSAESIIEKMNKRNLPLTYESMIENINDIAGIRIICNLKKDIFSIRDLLKKISGVKVIKEKDYITKPKKSGYSSYHLIVQVPVILLQKNIYVKVEIQIRTTAMDFWANLEHKTRYKAEEPISDKEEKEWIKCAKMIHKLDQKMMFLS